MPADKQVNESPRLAVMFDSDDIEMIKQTFKDKGYGSFGEYVRSLLKKDGVRLTDLKRGGLREPKSGGVSGNV